MVQTQMVLMIIYFSVFWYFRNDNDTSFTPVYTATPKQQQNKFHYDPCMSYYFVEMRMAIYVARTMR